MTSKDNQLKFKNIYPKVHTHNTSKSNIDNIISEQNVSEKILDDFLEKERNSNLKEPWNKLNKTDKVKKLVDFVKIYVKENKIESEKEKMEIFMKSALENKKLSKIKDIKYDKENGIINSITGLTYDKDNKKFHLLRNDNSITSKNLAPKRNKISGKYVNKTLKKSPTKNDK